MFISAGIYTVIGTLADILRYVFRNRPSISVNGAPILTSMITKTGYYLLDLATLFILLIFLVKLINSFSANFFRTMKIDMLLWIIFSIIINSFFVLDPRISLLKQYVYLGISTLLTIASLSLLIKNIKINHEIFVVKFRGKVHVKENI